MRFRDRRDAGEQLARALDALVPGPATVLAIPRGGVLVAGAIVRARNWPLDLAIPRKLRAPQNPELAFGAVTGDGTVYVDAGLAKALRVRDAYLRDEIGAQIEEIERRRTAYRGTRPSPDVRGRTAVVVDDGVATGATMIVTVRMLRHALAREVVVAIPVGAPDAVRRLEREADRVVCTLRPPTFAAVGEFYEDFRQTTDEEVVETLREAWARTQVV
ncbi:MAG TPA: phosphoribosyltransferase family protein [bacterium]|nr:phosphoribosyltransferase family protein [bacterium]